MTPPLPVDPARVVIEVLESVRVDSDVIDALSAWRQRGYRIALDDFCLEKSDVGPLAFAEIVKLDVQLKNGKVEAYRSRISVSFKYESKG